MIDTPIIYVVFAMLNVFNYFIFRIVRRAHWLLSSPFLIFQDHHLGSFRVCSTPEQLFCLSCRYAHLPSTILHLNIGSDQPASQPNISSSDLASGSTLITASMLGTECVADRLTIDGGITSPYHRQALIQINLSPTCRSVDIFCRFWVRFTFFIYRKDERWCQSHVLA